MRSKEAPFFDTNLAKQSITCIFHMSKLKNQTFDKELYELLVSMRSHGWDRDLSEDTQNQLQKDWKISEYMDAKEWDGYGYPYQEELDEHVLDEKKLSKLAGGQDVYYIGDIVKQNKISDGQIVSKPIGNILPVGSQVKLKDIYIYEIHYYDLGHSF